jgi:protein-S-isoprenylcysteine O-methyltransferase Ste14
VLSVTRILQYLPLFVVLWMVIGAVIVFRPDEGRRDPRGLGIAVGLWGTLASTWVAMAPPAWVVIVGVAGVVSSLALHLWAALSIRGRLFSYAGNDDLPQFVHRAGPYAFIRNPFYASYLLAELSIVVMWPSGWGAAVVTAMVVYFQWLARYEEEKFARSPVAAEYQDYKARTGRLVPRWIPAARALAGRRGRG